MITIYCSKGDAIMTIGTVLTIAKVGSSILFRDKRHKNRKTKKVKKSSKKLRFKTKVGLAAAAVSTVAVGATAAAVLTHENKALTTKAYTVTCPNLPAEFDGLRLAHISDLHAATFGKNQKDLLALVDTLHADMALITGDLIDRRRTNSTKGMLPALTLLQQLQKRMPTLRVEGNHEAMSAVGPHFTTLADRTGAQNITARALTVQRGDSRLVFLGIPDIASFQYDKDAWKEAMNDLCAPYQDDFCVALSHRPQFFADYEKAGLPLVLCGHAHGGQVRLPLVGGLYAPEQGVLPTYTAGVHGKHDTRMIVSRGLGNSGFPFRFGNRPEVAIITLKRTEE